MKNPHIILLTHEREYLKPTNTGRLALDILPDYVEQVPWSRVEPYVPLVELLQNRRTALVYPSEGAKPLSGCAGEFDTYVILDATWQQAQKMYNQSPYLKSAFKMVIDTKTKSDYQLRRNQRSGGLCTLECISEIFKSKGLLKQQQILQDSFNQFNIKHR